MNDSTNGKNDEEDGQSVNTTTCKRLFGRGHFDKQTKIKNTFFGVRIKECFFLKFKVDNIFIGTGNVLCVTVTHDKLLDIEEVDAIMIGNVNRFSCFFFFELFF
jgi:hypothetical protein